MKAGDWGQRGSFTLEASVLFPVIMMLTIFCLLLSIVYFRHTMTAIDASVAAERSAFVWDNSAKEFITGAFPYDRHDGLYAQSIWDEARVLADWSGKPDAVWTLNVPEQPSTPTERKLAAAAKSLDAGTEGTISYDGGIVSSSISVSLRQPLLLSLPFGRSVRSTSATAISYAVEPEEAMRTVDLIRTYTERLRTFAKRDGSGAEQADWVPATEPTQDDVDTVISSEAEAKEYVRKLVGGTGGNFATIIGRYRQIDAIDADGVAHEAKYTVNQADSAAQIAKDVELMKSGVIKGVVWHFFRYRKTGKVQLTLTLRKQLERNGIIVIVHN